MIQEFITFVEQLFPSINPYTAEQTRDAIRQFDDKGQMYGFFMCKPFEYLSQGDIVAELPFTKTDSEGNESYFKSPAILLSNTCDAENDDFVVFSPLFPLDKIGIDKTEASKNRLFRLLYFPDQKLSNFIVDLGIMNSFSKTLVMSLLVNGTLTKIVSLNDLGYYLFLCKLTVHLMRPEDPGIQRERRLNVSGL